MSNSKKILIVYASSGAGHKKASEALRDVFLKFHKDIQIEFTDVLNFANPFFKKMYPATYEFIASHLPFLWAFFYYLLDLRRLSWGISKFHRMINSINCKGFENYILRNNFDAVIATHFLPVEIISYLKKRGRYKGKLLTIVTDFGLHNFWVSKYVDRYVVATKITKEDLLERGVAESKIEILGIPIGLEFLAEKNQAELSSKLGIKSGVFTVLIAGGGFGAGPVELILKRLIDLKITKQILVVCGSNAKLRQNLEGITRNHSDFCRIYGFVDNMDELMRISDVLIGKSGGLTSSEAVAVRIPLIIVSPIPGQEAKNAEILIRYDVAVRLKNPCHINKEIEKMVLNPDIMEKMKENAKFLSHPDSSLNIANLALKLLNMQE